jgi:hypothetical protein
MDISHEGGAAAEATGALMGRRQRPPSGPFSQATPERPPLPLHLDTAWLPTVTHLRRGEVYVLTGDVELAQTLAFQVALSIGSRGGHSLIFHNRGGAGRLAEQTRTSTAGWAADDAYQASVSVHSVADAGDIRDVACLIGDAVDRRLGTHRDASLIVFEQVDCGRVTNRTPGALATEHFARCVATCRVNGMALLAILAGPEDAARELAVAADETWHLDRRGDRYLLTVRKGGTGSPQSILLERDGLAGDLRPAPSVDPFPARARAWAGGEAPASDVEAILRPAEGSRPRVVAHGLPDRRVDLALSLLDGVPFLDLRRDGWDAEALLAGDVPFAGSMGLALAVALAGSLLRQAVPKNDLFCGEIGLDRRLRRLSAASVESLTFAAAEGRRVTPATRLFVAPATAASLDGIGCQIVSTPTLDAALLHLWPDLH